MTPSPRHRSDSPPPRDPSATPEEELVRDFARQFVEVRRGEVEGVSAWLAQGRLDLVARLGHQIKGTAPTFGLPEIGAAGARLEAAAREADEGEVERQVAVLLELMGSGPPPP